MSTPERSNGHICFVGEFEYYGVGDDLFRAPHSAPLADAQHKRRLGRWECSLAHARRYPTLYPFILKGCHVQTIYGASGASHYRISNRTGRQWVTFTPAEPSPK